LKRRSKASRAPRLATLDTAFRELIRARDRTCQFWRGLDAVLGDFLRCNGPLEVAHLVPRTRRSTRLDPSNAALLCHAHHALLDSRPLDKAEWIQRYLGEEEYEALKEKARTLYRGTNKDKWEELEALREMRKCIS